MFSQANQGSKLGFSGGPLSRNKLEPLKTHRVQTQAGDGRSTSVRPNVGVVGKIKSPDDIWNSTKN